MLHGLCVYLRFKLIGCVGDLKAVSRLSMYVCASKSIFMYPITESPASGVYGQNQFELTSKYLASIKSFVLFSHIQRNDGVSPVSEQLCPLSFIGKVITMSYNFRYWYESMLVEWRIFRQKPRIARGFFTATGNWHFGWILGWKHGTTARLSSAMWIHLASMRPESIKIHELNSDYKAYITHNQTT